jgi:chitin disaccharide deacetylase
MNEQAKARVRPGLRRIWLCADDYGMSALINTAIRDLVVRGRLNATSVLVGGAGMHRSEAVSLGLLNTATPRVAIGLHVALTAPLRPLSKGFVPTRSNTFLPLADTFRHALMRRFHMRALRDEVLCQMQSFFDLFGRAPDFVDGHHHVHLLPQVSEAVLQVVKESAPGAWLRQCGRVVPLRARFSDRKALLLDVFSIRFRRRAAALGLRTNPAFAGTYDFSPQTNYALTFQRFLEGLPDGGLVMCHPGFVDVQLQRLDRLPHLREREHEFFAGDAFPALLERAGMALAPPDNTIARPAMAP